MFRKLKSRIIRFFEGMVSKKKTGLVTGQLAPDFSLPDQEGKIFTLSAHRGKKVVLYFYPKDHTSGCTLESCNLRDHHSELTSQGYEIVGISNDDEASHRRFIADLSLPFSLLADTKKVVAKLYDVFGEKNFLGIRMSGIIRTTFVLDEAGIIARIITAVDTASHSSQITQQNFI
jgi:thioredoxin-dependent peroxiredoxin